MKLKKSATYIKYYGCISKGFDDFVCKKYLDRKRKNILIVYRGLLFLIERFHFFFIFYVIVFKEIIQNKIVGDSLSKEIILCLIIAGMVIRNSICRKEYASCYKTK